MTLANIVSVSVTEIFCREAVYNATVVPLLAAKWEAFIRFGQYFRLPILLKDNLSFCFPAETRKFKTQYCGQWKEFCLT